MQVPSWGFETPARGCEVVPELREILFFSLVPKLLVFNKIEFGSKSSVSLLKASAPAHLWN